ncbi:MAG: serine/threonine-protein kinase [Anaerolineaceae bacterium]|nr:serine/threonine-protein kinase [Anaerolineaceae bacterium]
MYINAFNGNTPLGRFNLPRCVRGENGNEYQIGSTYTQGGNGIVFQSYQVNDNGTINRDEFFAIKILKQQETSRVDRFRNEVRIIRELNHDRIAKYYDNGSVEAHSENDDKVSIPWLAIELGNDNMAAHISRHGPLPPQLLIGVCLQICDALAYFHSLGYIHRDIKPANFVWGRERGCIKMIDFGIAKRMDEDVSGRPLDNFTRQQEFVGPVFFSSPELIASAEDKSHPVDHRSDLFQLGKVIWYLATGKVSAGIPSKKDCPVIHEIVMALLFDDPNERIETASEVGNVLREIKL